MALIIDIETISWFKDEEHKQLVLKERQNKTLKDPDKIAENHKKIINEAALSPYTGQLTVIGMKYTDKSESFIYTLGYTDPVDSYVNGFPTERELLIAVWASIAKAIDNGERLVTFNGKSFDLPFLFIRSLINNINAGLDYMGLIHPYNHDLHLDIKSLFDKGSLKEIAYALDCKTDNEIDGSELPELWKSDPAKVVEKNKSDLIQTEKIYERVKGWIPQRLQMYSSSKMDSII
ncbi:ribonuclease H-like domain-containing protein [Immundisolibacter sp.]